MTTAVDVADGAGNGSSGSADSDTIAAVGAGNGAGGRIHGDSVEQRRDHPSPQVRRWRQPPRAGPRIRPENEAIDLLDIGGAAVLKRVAPLAVGLVVLFVLWRLLHRR